jgi:hypothetical protein
MQSYGTVVIQDGVYSTSKPEGTSGFVTYPLSEGVLSPNFSPKADLKTFVVDIHYLDYKYIYSSHKPLATIIPVNYDKQYTRIASEKNTVRAGQIFRGSIRRLCGEPRRSEGGRCVFQDPQVNLQLHL